MQSRKASISKEVILKILTLGFYHVEKHRKN